MKPEIDKKYLKISLYVIFTVVAIYFLSKLVNLIIYIVSNFSEVANGFLREINIIVGILSVLITAAIISYLLDPLVEIFQKKANEFSEKKLLPIIDKCFVGNKYFVKRTKRYIEKRKECECNTRTSGTILVYFLIFIVLVIIILFIYIRIFSHKVSENTTFVNWIIDSVNQSTSTVKQFKNSFDTTQNSSEIPYILNNMINGIINVLEDLVLKLSSSVIDIITSAGTMLMNFIMSLVIAFYFLRDKEIILNSANEMLDLFIPKKINKHIKILFGDLNAVFSGYVRAQIINAIVIGVIISVVLSIIGVKFAIFIGIFSGIANLIPYFGAFIAFVLSITVGVITSGSNQAIMSAIAIMMIQLINGMFIVPKIMGKQVKLSPASVLIALSIFGTLYGVAGMIFAVPVFAICKIYIERLKERRRPVTESRE